MSRNGHYQVALDLGATVTRALVCQRTDDAQGPAALRFLGYGEAESQGWRRGTIADLDPVAASVRRAVEQVEAAAGVPVEAAIVGVGGAHIQGNEHRAALSLSSHPRDVTCDDVQRVMDKVREIPLPPDREILHVIPREFAVDSEEGIRDPVGMQGLRLEVAACLITGSVAAGQNVVTAVNRAGILVETTVFEAMAASEALLSQEERELGTLLMLLGGGSCEMAAFRQEGLKLAAALPIGGDLFTSDVAVGLRTPLLEAERIKRTFGTVLPGQCNQGTSIEISAVGDRPARLVPHRTLSEILEPRAQELLGLAQAELRRCGIDRQLGAGVVLAGGGSRLAGLCDLAEQVLGVPARLGLPTGLDGMPEPLDSPDYATLVGLAVYGNRLWQRRAASSRSFGGRWKSLLAGKR